MSQCHPLQSYSLPETYYPLGEWIGSIVKPYTHQVAPHRIHGPSRWLCWTGFNSMSRLVLLRARRQRGTTLAESIPCMIPLCPRISPFHDRFLFESEANLYFHSTPLATDLASLSHRNDIYPVGLAIVQNFRRAWYAII